MVGLMVGRVWRASALGVLAVLGASAARAEAAPKAITASIPLSHVSLEDVQVALQSLPEELRERLAPDEMVFSQRGKVLVVHDRPSDVALLRDLLRRIDVGPKQVQVEIAVVEAPASQGPGMDLANVGAAEDFVRAGGRVVARGALRVVDQETATLTIGQIWSVQAQAVGAGAATEEEALSQEVPVGITLNLTPDIHNDGTVTVQLDVQDERAIAVRPTGVDRETRSSTSTVRLRDGERVAVGGFISGAPGVAGAMTPDSRASSEGARVPERVVLLSLRILDLDAGSTGDGAR